MPTPVATSSGQFAKQFRLENERAHARLAITLRDWDERSGCGGSVKEGTEERGGWLRDQLQIILEPFD